MIKKTSTLHVYMTTWPHVKILLKHNSRFQTARIFKCSQTPRTNKNKVLESVSGFLNYFELLAFRNATRYQKCDKHTRFFRIDTSIPTQLQLLLVSVTFLESTALTKKLHSVIFKIHDIF